MPRACWQRRTPGNSVYYALEIASIPVNTTEKLKETGPVSQSPLPPRWPRQPWISTCPALPDSDHAVMLSQPRLYVHAHTRWHLSFLTSKRIIRS